MDENEGIYLARKLLKNAISDQHLLDLKELVEVRRHLARTERFIGKLERVKVGEEALILEAGSWESVLHERRRAERARARLNATPPG